MKQARAFGVGVLVATQNPMDLDYRALGNAGVWCVGRLQTDADCVRVVDGMASSDGTSRDSAKQLAATVKRLALRWFVMRDAHMGAAPFLMQPRWAMSLLRGPMTRVELDAARRLASRRRGRDATERPWERPMALADVAHERPSGLVVLRSRIRAAHIPPARPHNLRLATWNIRRFGEGKRTDESIAMIAAIVRQFDLVSIVELCDDTTDLQRLIRALGTHHGVVFSDYLRVAAGAILTGRAAEHDGRKWDPSE